MLVFLNSIKTNFRTRLPPNLHNLTDYSRVIRSMGPTVHQNTIRFEGKHKILKDILSRMRNFQNPCKSIAVRHQQHISISDFGMNPTIVIRTKIFLQLLTHMILFMKPNLCVSTSFNIQRAISSDFLFKIKKYFGYR